MKLLEIPPHAPGKRMENVPVPDIRLLDAGQAAGSRMHPQTDRLLFVMTGSLRLPAGSGVPPVLAAGQLICLPEGTETIPEPEPDTTVVVYGFDDDVFRGIESGSGWGDAAKDAPEMAGTNTEKPVSGSPDTGSPDDDPAVFPIRPQLHDFLSAFCRQNPAIRRDPAFRQLKSREILFWLRRSYRAEELKRIFRPVRRRETDFRDRAIRYASGARSVAQLAREMACSPSTLNRFFNRTFGMPVYRWMQRQKARKVRELLTRSDLPLESVRKSCGFTSAAHLTKFCKQYLGATPSAVRKQAVRKNRSLRKPDRKKAFPGTLPPKKRGRMSGPASSDTD